MMVDIANGLSKNHDIDFLTYRNDKVLQQLNNKVNHIHNTLYRNKFKPFENLGQIYILHKILKKSDYDIAIAFLHPSNYMLTLAAKGTKTKVLLSERADPYSRKKNGGFFVHCIEHVLHFADGYVFQSEGAKGLYPSKCRKKGVVIVNSIPDVVAEHHITVRKKTIAHVARMEIIQKRQDIMLKAFKIFSQKHPEYTLEFYGDGPDENKVKSMVCEMGMDSRVEFKGAQRNILNLISDAEMFVLTSDYEGLPNALLEAASIGLPCISTDCSPGGARMVIENGRNGFVVPCGDYAALAEKMNIIVENKDIAKSFSLNAAEIKEKFNAEKIYLQWEKFITTL